MSIPLYPIASTNKIGFRAAGSIGFEMENCAIIYVLIRKLRSSLFVLTKSYQRIFDLFKLNVNHIPGKNY